MDRSFLALAVAGGVLSLAILYVQRCNENSLGNVLAEPELKETSGLFLLQQGLLMASKAVPSNEPTQLTSGGSNAERLGVARAGHVFSLEPKKPCHPFQSP